MKTLLDKIQKIFVISLVIWVSACSTHLPPAGLTAYNQCKYDKAIDIFTMADKKDKDALLYDLAILSSAVHQGNAEIVKKSGLRAQQKMWAYEGNGAGVASLISSEALRIYKGDPFEKVMASLYLGIVYFNEQDYDNAKAAFTKAVFAVQTKDENIRPDFAAPYFLLAKTYLKLKDEDNARITLERLKNLLPAHKLSIEQLKKIHTIAFIEIGKGPIKMRTGPGDSLIAWQRQSYLDRRAMLHIDGKPIDVLFGSNDDLTYQARTADRGGKTAIQGAKGALREASAVTAIIAANEAANRKSETAAWVALGTGLFALANQSQADIRQWELLPDRLDLLFSPDPTTPGRHEYSVVYLNRFQNDLSSQPQVWYDERTLDQDKIYIVSAHNCGNKPL